MAPFEWLSLEAKCYQVMVKHSRYHRQMSHSFSRIASREDDMQTLTTLTAERKQGRSRRWEVSLYHICIRSLKSEKIARSEYIKFTNGICTEYRTTMLIIFACVKNYFKRYVCIIRYCYRTMGTAISLTRDTHPIHVAQWVPYNEFSYFTLLGPLRLQYLQC